MQKTKTNIIRINSRKFDGAIHKTWTAELVEQKNPLLILIGEFEKEIKHSHLGVIGRGTISYEFYWLGGWFNVFRFHEPDGSLRNFYCNLNMPPQFQNNVLDYVDLDIDVLIWKDFSIEILDLDEFAANSKKFNYSKEINERTKEALKTILKLYATREFPFNIKTMI